jgi:hypothetical protein
MYKMDMFVCNLFYLLLYGVNAGVLVRTCVEGQTGRWQVKFPGTPETFFHTGRSPLFLLLLDCRSGKALPIEANIEVGASQNKSGTSVN